MTRKKEEQADRQGDRRDSGGRGDRRGLSSELFPGEEITHEDVGLKLDRREDGRRAEKERRD